MRSLFHTVGIPHKKCPLSIEIVWYSMYHSESLITLVKRIWKQQKSRGFSNASLIGHLLDWVGSVWTHDWSSMCRAERTLILITCSFAKLIWLFATSDWSKELRTDGCLWNHSKELEFSKLAWKNKTFIDWHWHFRSLKNNSLRTLILFGNISRSQSCQILAHLWSCLNVVWKNNPYLTKVTLLCPYQLMLESHPVNQHQCIFV